jgi:hypothetical protein
MEVNDKKADEQAIKIQQYYQNIKKIVPESPEKQRRVSLDAGFSSDGGQPVVVDYSPDFDFMLKRFKRISMNQ